jgi:hypothetical protein
MMLMVLTHNIMILAPNVIIIIQIKVFYTANSKQKRSRFKTNLAQTHAVFRENIAIASQICFVAEKLVAPRSVARGLSPLQLPSQQKANAQKANSCRRSTPVVLASFSVPVPVLLAFYCYPAPEDPKKARRKPRIPKRKKLPVQNYQKTPNSAAATTSCLTSDLVRLAV